jgi:integrase
MGNHITVYRRHSRQQNDHGVFESICTQHREQDDRCFVAVLHKTDHGTLKVHQPVKKTDQRHDCNCPIVADGSLGNELGRIRYRSLDTRSWEEAVTRATAKLKSGTWAEPIKATPLPESSFDQMTVEKAVSIYLKSIGPGGKNLSDRGYSLYRVLLEDRLLPFCTTHEPPITFMMSLQNATINEEFTQSWQLLPKFEGDPKAGKPMLIGAKAIYVQRWRKFLKYAKDMDWITKIPKIEAPEINQDQRPSLLAEEFERVQNEANNWSLKHKGYSDKKAAELRLAMFLFERTGMRVSDVATLADTDIVWFEQGQCHAIDKIEWKLRRKGIRLWHPIDEDVYEALIAHGHKGKKHGKRYYFWTGNGKEESCIDNLAQDIQKLINWAQDPDPITEEFRKPFHVHATTHTLRHTYGQLLYDSGTDLSVVSELMGHRKLATTQKFYVGRTNERKALLAEIVRSKARPKSPDNIVPFKKKA